MNKKVFMIRGGQRTKKKKKKKKKKRPVNISV